MYLHSALILAGALAPIVTAHDGAPVPKLFGLNVKDLKRRDLLSNLKARAAGINQVEARVSHEALEARQNLAGQCGPGFGSCAPGVCCSEGGWCGTTADYCYSPGCKYQYGPGCNENKTPAGASTSTVSRTKVGSVPYGGAGIYSCENPGTVAITYDDGPYQDLTSHILDLFQSYNGKATFFITGANANKGQIDTTPEFVNVIKRMHNEGHQLASHTWTHLDLSAISETERRDQMYKLEMAMRNIVGFFPTYMRPPYSSCTAQSGCQQTMADLGYHISYFDVDTDDYNQATAAQIQNSKNWFRGNITAGGATPANDDWLGIAHDIHYQTAYNLTEYMLSTITQLGYRAVTMGECLNDPVENWYRSSSGGGTPTTTTRPPTTTPTPPPSGGTTVSPNGSCGGTTGYTCAGSSFGTCCSQYGWCGSTSGHCGAGCQSGFGTCTSGPGGAKISTDGTCGGTQGFTCAGSAFGNCCSQYGWCGSSAGHCGTGCQRGFGTCT
ncbi:carbohydrate esterase family 4 protein [Sporormia fimetaria CBS 119925]|uniref:Carbohydrate esterase family 4 protein n=1 Tax=Sporormia fimetaria CBS 119925 TaxID=1340428 RepID=A0A6A6VBX8_9PLEO|nr:carbohydrate esterase family 4 protein [Sporormia fimetaria CBS 119925]